MKRLAFSIIVLAALASSGLLAQDLARLLKTAINTEMVDGDPEAAIGQYKKVAASGDRALAAQALLRMAGCYQKLGGAEAQKIYAQIIRDYADQTTVAAEARARITQPATVAPRAFDPVPVDTRLGLYWVPSPDGRLAAGVPSGGPDSGLILHDLVAGTQRVVVKSESPQSFVRSFEVWSPDGRRGVYVWRRTGLAATGQAPSIEICVIDAASGATRTIATRPAGTAGAVNVRAWTTKDEIVFTVGQREVFFVNAAGGKPEQMTLPESAQFGDVVPDGSALLLVDSERLIRRERATGQEQVLTSGFEVSTPRTSRDGKLIAYLAKQSATWSFRVAPLTTMPISRSVEIAQTPPPAAMLNRFLRWTSDRIMFDAEVTADSLYGVKLDGDLKPAGPLARLVHETWSAGRAVISPDDRRIAYVGGRSLAVMNADGSGERDLVEGPPVPLGWLSADELVFNGSVDEGLFAVSLRTGTIRSLMGHDAPIQASPFASSGLSETFQYLSRRNEIVFRRFVADRAVFVARQPGGAERTILEILLGAAHRPGRPLLRTWAISPVGDRIAYVTPTAPGSGDLRLHVRTIGRDDDRVVGRVERPSISWTADGRRLTYFTTSPKGELEVVRLDVDTGESVTLLDSTHLQGVFPSDSRWVITECSLASDQSFLACTALVTATQRSAWGGVTYEAVTDRLGRK